MTIGGREFDIKNHCYVMGILNVTPDSFFDGGRFQKTDQVLFHVEKMITEGVDMIDIGGESTRPGYREISVEEEIERIIPIIEKIKTRFNVIISTDTCKADVAKEAIAAGADMINDIWGLKKDANKIADVIAAAGVPCCLMHNRSEPTDGSIITDVIDGFSESLALAKKVGIAEDKIILDPGIGFGKTYEQNLKILAELEKLHILGYPLLVGCSRKSVIGLTLNAPVEDRLAGTLAATVAGVMKGCSFVRVHDVKENVQAVKMAEAILYA